MKKTVKQLFVAFLVLTLIVVCPGAVNKAKAASEDPLVNDTVTMNAGGSKGYNFKITASGKVYVDFFIDKQVDLTVGLRKVNTNASLVNTVIKADEWVDGSTIDSAYSGIYAFSLYAVLDPGEYYVQISPSAQARINTMVFFEEDNTTPTPTQTPLTMSQSKLTITAGQSHKLSVTGASGTVKWASSKKSVATVKSGKVTAKKAGKTTITAKSGNKTAKCVVTVKSNVYTGAKVSLSNASYGVTAGIYKAYYSKGKLVVKLRIYNNTSYYITKFKKIKIVAKTATGATIANYSVAKNIAMPAHTTKDITITIPKSKVKKKTADLRNASMKTDGSYTYRY